MRTTKFEEKFKLGKVDEDNIYLSPPSWDCDWYWGFGYLGNKDCHYHLDGLSHTKNLFDALKEHFGDSLTIKEDKHLWTFCELIQTFYNLKETAEVFGRGGSNYTSNPISELIIDKNLVYKINNIILPKLFDEIETILSNYRQPPCPYLIILFNK